MDQFRGMYMKYIIKDWAGNILTYTGKFNRPEFAVPMKFDAFDLASDWLADTFGHLSDAEFEIEMQEYFIDQENEK
jgi:hypothetical protein